MKKLTALCLTFVLAFALSVPAFATSSDTVVNADIINFTPEEIAEQKAIDLDDLSTTKVSLPQNEKIHGFSLTDDTLFVSVAAKTSEEDRQNPYIESFDLETGKSIKKRSLSAPLYSITTNDSDQYP